MLAIRRKPVPTPEPVLLCTPPSAFLLDERVFVALGILKVGAVLEQAGFRVEHLDLSGVENYLAAFEAHLQTSPTRHICFTATTPQLPAAIALATAAREQRPDAKLILGGAHATLVHAAVRKRPESRGQVALTTLKTAFDVIVAGDGESAVFDALCAKPGSVIDGDDPKGGLFMSNADYDASPWPARHLVDMASYHYSVDGEPACSVIGQLGCPYNCRFCGGRSSSMLRRIRTRTTENVVAEIEHVHRTYGPTGWMFLDDELNVSREMVPLMLALSELQSKLGVDFRMRGFVKANLFNEEQAAALYAAGFRWILCGFEGAHPRILENIDKKATRADNDRVMELADKHGLKVKALMSIGHAGETAETIDAVRQWLLQVKPADFDCTIISTYPGTPYYDEADPHPALPGVWTYVAPKSGDKLHAYEVDYSKQADYYKGVPGEYQSLVFTDALAAEDIVRLRDALEADVRAKLGIPFNPGAPGVRYEHSMGASGPLPPTILRRSA